MAAVLLTMIVNVWEARFRSAIDTTSFLSHPRGYPIDMFKISTIFDNNLSKPNLTFLMYYSSSLITVFIMFI
jgi:hypothetical protein